MPDLATDVDVAEVAAVDCAVDVAAALTLSQQFAALLASKGKFAFEARSNTNDGTNVLTFVDLIDPTRILTVSGTLPKPVADAGFAGAPVCTATGTQSGACNKGPTPFRFLHDGTGMEVRSVFSPAAGQGVLLGTRTTAAGWGAACGSNLTSLAITNAAGAAVCFQNIACVVGAVVSAHCRYSSSLSPNITHHVTGTTDYTGAQAAAPALGDPDLTLTLFTEGTSFFKGRWFGSYGFLPLTTSERALLDAYTTAQIGVSTP